MTKIMVPLDWETVDNIVVMQIQEMKESLEWELVQVKNNKKGTVFDTDYKKDMKTPWHTFSDAKVNKTFCGAGIPSGA